ncbi:MAG: fumarate hydratase [Thermodesulfobacteriota bacterium]
MVKAGTTFRKDQWDAYRNAIRREKDKNAKWVLEKILENAEIAEKKKFPLCDDTGIPHVFNPPPELAFSNQQWGR